MRGLRRVSVAVGVSVAVLLSACGGGDGDDSLGDLLGGGGQDDGGDGLGDDVFGDVGDAADSGSVGGGSVEVMGAPTLTAEPGTAVVEVDGQRIEYLIAGAINVACDISADVVTINIQTPEGQSFLLQASTNTGSWLGSMTAATSDSNVQYGSALVGGVLGIGDNAVSYEGPMTKVVDRDIVNAEEMQGTLAVNCATPGGDPSATVGDQSFTFPITGAQSFRCTAGPEEFEILVNRLAIDNLQLQMDGRFDGTQWIGAITVFTADGNLSAPLPADGAGLTIDGSTVTFEGTFTAPDGTESQGSAQATC